LEKKRGDYYQNWSECVGQKTGKFSYFIRTEEMTFCEENLRYFEYLGRKWKIKEKKADKNSPE